MRHLTSPFHSTIAAVAMAALLAGCAGSKPVAPANNFTWLGQAHLGLKSEARGPAPSGLSGVNYDPASGNWVPVAGDRPNRLARTYTAR